jgi:hypothetical protein
MKTHLLAAELARIVPELAKDSAVNRETVIRNMIDRELTPPAAAPHNALSLAAAPVSSARRASI